MKLNRTLRPEQAWLLLVALLLVLAVAFVVFFTARVHTHAAQTLEQIEPRYARISGLLHNQTQIAQAGQTLESSLTRYVYPESGDASQIGNQALQKVRDLATAQGLRVVSSQSQTAKQDNDHPGLDRIGIEVRIEGDWNELQKLLAELPRQMPAIYLSTLQLTNQGVMMAGPDAPSTISGQFDLYVLKVHPTDTPVPAQVDSAQGAQSAPGGPQAAQNASLSGHPSSVQPRSAL
jgi:general secretion pathway protein M